MAEQKIELYEGEKGVLLIELKNDDGTAYDLSAEGGTTVLKMYVRAVHEKDDADNIVDGDNLSVVDAAAGTANWAFDFTALDMNWQKAVWVVWRESTDGTVKRFTRKQPFVLHRNRFF